jgi:hypothetical protein
MTNQIEVNKYEGHTQGPWKASHDVVEYGHIVNNTGWRVYVGEHEKRAEIQNYRFDHDELSEANAQLIADAPLLLAEVIQLRKQLGAYMRFQLWVQEEHNEIHDSYEDVDEL